MADRLGTQVGNYRLSQLLGRGGFAEVYLGVHVHLGTQAAVKLLHTSLASAGEIEKFREEARLIAMLQHPHILRVLEFGIDAGQPYLVLEHAPGGSLRERHPAGTQVPLATVVSYVQQIAQALQFAHDQKLIHRDIKPQNLLLGRSGEILLSDFGISVVAESTSRQQAQGFAGTVAYSAPEQLQEHPRPASDQYALGAVVYEWLTGTVPFTGAFQEIIAKQLFVAPPPLREHLKSLPAAVEEVVLTALAKDPKERFASVSAFAKALEQASTLATPTLPVMAPAHSQPPSGGTPASMQAPHSPGGALAMTEVPPVATPNVLLPTNGHPAALAESAPAATDSAGLCRSTGSRCLLRLLRSSRRRRCSHRRWHKISPRLRPLALVRGADQRHPMTSLPPHHRSLPRGGWRAGAPWPAWSVLSSFLSTSRWSVSCSRATPRFASRSAIWAWVPLAGSLMARPS